MTRPGNTKKLAPSLLISLKYFYNYFFMNQAPMLLLSLSSALGGFFNFLNLNQQYSFLYNIISRN